jgi:hypothetical protein
MVTPRAGGTRLGASSEPHAFVNLAAQHGGPGDSERPDALSHRFLGDPTT